MEGETVSTVVQVSQGMFMGRSGISFSGVTMFSNSPPTVRSQTIRWGWGPLRSFVYDFSETDILSLIVRIHPAAIQPEAVYFAVAGSQLFDLPVGIGYEAFPHFGCSSME